MKRIILVLLGMFILAGFSYANEIKIRNNNDEVITKEIKKDNWRPAKNSKNNNFTYWCAGDRFDFYLFEVNEKTHTCTIYFFYDKEEAQESYSTRFLFSEDVEEFRTQFFNNENLEKEWYKNGTRKGN